MGNLTLNRRLAFGIGAILLLLIVLASVSFYASRQTARNMQQLTDDHLPHLIEGQLIFNEANTIGRAVRNMYIAGANSVDDKAMASSEWEKILEARRNIAKAIDNLTEQAKNNNDPDAQKEIDALKELGTAFVSDQDKFKAAFDAGDMAAAKTIVLVNFQKSYAAYRELLVSITKAQQEDTLNSAKELKSLASSTQIEIISVSLLGIVLSLAIAFLLLKRVRQQLGGELEEVQSVIAQIANGDFSQKIDLQGVPEDSLLANIGRMQLQLREGAILSAENARIKTALDSVSTSVMIADAERNIIYCNRAQDRLLQAAEADLRKELPQFSARSVLGTNIDSFHKNPAHQRSMLERLTGEHKTNIAVGPRRFNLTINPVENDKKQRAGYVVEWIDQTEILAQQAREHALATESSRILGALDATSSNVMIADAERTIIYMNSAVKRMLSEAQNDLRKVLPHFDVSKLIGTSMDTFHRNPSHQSSLLANLTNTYRSQISVAGRTFVLIANPVFSHDGQRLGSVVEWIDRTAEVAVESEVNQLVDAAINGDFSKRINPAGKEGFMLKLAEGMNQLVISNEAGMSDVARVLGALAQGDLTQKITADYRGLLGQLKDDSNMTCDRLAEIVTNIQEASNTINVAAQEIAAGNSNLSSRTEQQAASLEETASSMEELTGTVKQNAENARQANQLAIGASDIAVKGGEVVSQVVSTMSEINDSAKKIVDIISVIDGIAFQTNILALNAAVEAARAGEQGRGFAVVASEVRNLAQRSAGAAKEIKTLIGDSVLKVETGSKLVDQAGHTMQDVVGAVRRVTDIMSEISAASNEQSAGIEQVNQAITHMDENTQQNAALVEEAAAAAESLEDQANNLTQTVGIFKLIGGKKLQTKVLASRPAPAKHVATAAPVAAAPKPSAKSIPKQLNSSDGDWEEF